MVNGRTWIKHLICCNMATSTMNGNERNLRHKSVKVYDDDEVEDEIDGKRTFDVMDKVKSNRFITEVTE